MPEKWTRKEVIEHAKTLRSPFETMGQSDKLLRAGASLRAALQSQEAIQGGLPVPGGNGRNE